jgi:hypothetical protein
MGKFVFFMIHSQNKGNIRATSMVSTVDLSTQKKQVEKVMEEYSDIFPSPTGVPLHCQVKHTIDMTSDAPLPRTDQQGAHPPQLITLQEPNRASTEERWDLTTLYLLPVSK